MAGADPYHDGTAAGGKAEGVPGVVLSMFSEMFVCSMSCTAIRDKILCTLHQAIELRQCGLLPAWKRVGRGILPTAIVKRKRELWWALRRKIGRIAREAGLQERMIVMWTRGSCHSLPVDVFYKVPYSTTGARRGYRRRSSCRTKWTTSDG